MPVFSIFMEMAGFMKFPVGLMRDVSSTTSMWSRIADHH